MPNVSREGILHIPAQALAQYKNVTTLEVKVIAARIDFITGHVTSTDTVVMMMDTREYFTGADILPDVPGTGTLMVTLQVRAMHKDGLSCNRQYQAADIIAVIAPHTTAVFHKPTYPQRAIIGTPTLLKRPYTQADLLRIQRE
jgi:hypothetical protein